MSNGRITTTLVNLTKTCRATHCTRSPGTRRLCVPCTTHIEQRLAYGDRPGDAARHAGTTTGDAYRVGELMDAAARDRTTPPPPPRLCPRRLHEMTPDNLVGRSDRRRECLACKRARARAYYREKKAS